MKNWKNTILADAFIVTLIKTSAYFLLLLLELYCQWERTWLIYLFFWRDVRRLVVAMSRARLGLYIFARVSLFQNCFELTPAFSQLTARPLHLHIIPTECFPAARQVGTATVNFAVCNGVYLLPAFKWAIRDETAVSSLLNQCSLDSYVPGVNFYHDTSCS